MKMPKLNYTALQVTFPSEWTVKAPETKWSERVNQVDEIVDRMLSEIPNVKSIVTDEQKLELDNLAMTIKEIQRLLSKNFHLKKKV